MESLLKRAIKISRQAAGTALCTRGEVKQSAEVNSAAAREVKLLLLGHNEDERSRFLVAMELLYGGAYSLDEREAARKTICSSIYRTISDVLDEVEASGTLLAVDYLGPMVFRLHSTDHGSIPQDVADAIRSLWSNLAVKKICRDVTDALYHDCITHFLDSIDRIAKVDYIPTDYDMVKARYGLSKPEMVELSLTVGQSHYSIVKPEMMSDMRRFLPAFEGFHCLIFFADLSTYTTVGCGGEADNGLNKSLSLFERLCNSSWLKSMSKIVFLTNLNAFKTQLVEKPLQHYFLDFEGGDDSEAAQKYIFARFLSLRQDDGLRTGKIYFHFWDADDPKTVKATLPCVQDIALQICIGTSLIK